jgi:uncharacterized protein DUF1592/uncharacterized protein DUF1588/uncharacterized protein DUF1595/uncharacterized protein DUF1587/uncharacterized protein DUF1585
MANGVRLMLLRTGRIHLALGGVLLAAACTGTIGDGGEGLGQGQSSICVGESPMRRLTRFEYNNTVHDLLGDTTRPADSFVSEGNSFGFDNQASSLTVSQLLAEQYLEASEVLSENATADMPGLLDGCDTAATGEDECAAQFVTRFGKKAFRRPLTEDETSAYVSLYAEGKAGFDFETGIQLVIQAMLQSPGFLYRVEFGMPTPIEGDVVQLDGWEMASRLSYLLWGSMPDDELFQAAELGQLASKEQIAAQARRMLADPRAREAVAHFHVQWLGLNNILTIGKDETIYPDYYDGLRALWLEETKQFVEHVVFDGEGDLGTLLTADYSMMNAELASFYGASGASGSEFVEVSLDPSQRAGIMTLPAVMAGHAKPNQSSPVLRGKFVREQLLCQILPPPPNNVNNTPPDVAPGSTTAEKFEQHSSDPNCAPCHKLMDPLGLGFENYDALGRWRDTDQDLPVVADGEVLETEDIDGEFTGAVELAGKLAESNQVRECVVKEWFRFGFGRSESQSDVCALDQLNELFGASGYDIKELLVGLTQTDGFLYRHAVVAGGAP